MSLKPGLAAVKAVFDGQVIIIAAVMRVTADCHSVCAGGNCIYAILAVAGSVVALLPDRTAVRIGTGGAVLDEHEIIGAGRTL